MADRSVSQVFSDIVGNAQEIIRAEVQLAKSELRDEALAARPRIVFAASGLLAGCFAILFTLASAYLALAGVLADWAAALIVALATAVVAAALLNAAKQRAPRLPAKHIPVETAQEDHT